MRTVPQSERFARMEEKVTRLEEEMREVNKKLDDILALRNKGVGAFWVASSLIGTGIVGMILQVIAWFKS